MPKKKKSNDETVKKDELTDEELEAVAGGIVMPIDSTAIGSTSLTTSLNTSTFTSPTLLSTFKFTK